MVVAMDFEVWANLPFLDDGTVLGAELGWCISGEERRRYQVKCWIVHSSGMKISVAVTHQYTVGYSGLAIIRMFRHFHHHVRQSSRAP